MSAQAPKLEVAKDGVVKIPKSVFESAPAVAPAGEPVTTVKRLDGTVETLVKIGKDNPNFVPRKAWPGGNIVTSNKDEALIKYHERKGIPLPDHLQKKRDEVLAAAAARNSDGSSGARDGGKASARARASAQKPGAAPVFKPSGNYAAWKASRPKGGIVKLSGAEGASGSSGATVVAPVQRPGTEGASTAPVEAPAPRKERPKGGVRILSGAEGGMAPSHKRAHAESGENEQHEDASKASRA